VKGIEQGLGEEARNEEEMILPQNSMSAERMKACSERVRKTFLE
jgi:hypothetical protein